jgi:hypothetical protein
MTPSPCDRIETMLEDYAQGRLGPTDHRSVEAHLSGCPACRRQLAEAERLVSAIRDLPPELPPESDLWPGIAGRLAPRGSLVRHTTQWLPLAAAVLLAFATGALLMRSLGLRPEGEGGVERAEAEVPVEARAELARRRDGCARLRRDLVVAVERSRATLDPSTVATIRTNMQILDRVVDELQTASARRPDDPTLRLRLADAYRQEMELLARLDHLPWHT